MKILFYADWELALTYLKPVYDFIKEKEPTWDLFFSGDADFTDVRVDKKEADIAICCDKLSACPTKNRLVIFHGVSSKGQDYCVSDRNVLPTDVSFVPSEYYRKLYIEKDGASPDKVISAGISKFDTIKEIPEPNKVPKILYAPTHNGELSSIPLIGDDIYKLDNLTVHLHMYTRKSDKPTHIKKRNKFKKHEPIEDITDLMVNSDIVIADLGSTVLEALALGKMVIQVKNPEHLAFYKQKVGDISEIPEIMIPAKFAYQATNIEEIQEIIKKYPKHTKPDFSIIDNIGNYKVSKIIYDYINNFSSR